MKPEHKKILIIAIVVGISVIAVLALVLGLVLGLRKKDKTDKNEQGVLNS